MLALIYLFYILICITVLGLLAGLASFVSTPAPTAIAFPLSIAVIGLLLVTFEILLVLARSWRSLLALLFRPIDAILCISAFSILVTKFDRQSCSCAVSVPPSDGKDQI